MSGWHKRYKERYERLKESGRPFFPDAVAKDAVVAALLFTALASLAWRYGAGLEPPADPTDATYNPRPEWYFLFLFQALKLFPGSLESVAAVLLPAAGLLFLALIPFIDRGPERGMRRRPGWTLLGLAAAAGFAALTWAGLRSPLLNPAVEKAPEVVEGRRLYREFKCAYCHSLDGAGGRIGPELDSAAAERSVEWLSRHFKDPQATSPGSTMPKLDLLDDEVRALVAYLRSQPGAEPYTAQAPRLFAENCASCHRVAGEGAEVGPDLSSIGLARDKSYLKRYIEDPSRFDPSSAMPGFKGQLSDTQIEDVARYLSSLGHGRKGR